MKKFWRLYWNCLHYLSYLYKPIHKNQLIKLINKMKTNGIKCSKCNNHFNEFTNNYNINNYLNNKEDLIKYFLILHNNINKNNFSIQDLNNLYINFDDTELKSYGIDIQLLLNMNKLEKLIDIINTTLYYRLLIEDNKLN